MKRQRKIIKLVIFISVVITSIIMIHTIRNYIIIEKMISEGSKYANSTNFSYKQNYYVISKEQKTSEPRINEIYYKDEVFMIKLNDTTIWHNKRDGELIWLQEMQSYAVITETSEDFSSNVKVITLEIPNEITKKLAYAFTSFISNTEISGKQSYVIKNGKNKTYINKENGIVLKNCYKEMDHINVYEYSDWKIDELTEEEMKKPDLSEYQIANP